MEIKKNIIVTGAYGAIGREIARQLAEKGHFVCLVGRDEDQLEKAREAIIRDTANEDIAIAAVDLSSKKSIMDFCNDWQRPLHVLINNASTTPRHREENDEGLEMQFAVNILGYFRMIKYLTCILNTSAPARIVNVASYYAGGMMVNDLQFNERVYNNDAAYRQSKQAERMLTVAFAERLQSLGITVNSCHPGEVDTKLSNSMGFRGSTPVADGAATPVFLALDPSVENVTGKFFARKHEERDEFAWHRNEIERLYEVCEEFG